MQFEAIQVTINDQVYWKDLIEMAFKNKNNECLSILRIIADETVYIEYNDQMNFIKACFKNVSYALHDSELTISVGDKIHNQHLSADLMVDIRSACDIQQKRLVLKALDTLLEKS